MAEAVSFFGPENGPRRRLFVKGRERRLKKGRGTPWRDSPLLTRPPLSLLRWEDYDSGGLFRAAINTGTMGGGQIKLPWEEPAKASPQSPLRKLKMPASKLGAYPVQAAAIWIGSRLPYQRSVHLPVAFSNSQRK